MSKKQGKKGKTLEELLEEALVPEEEQPYPVPENWVWVRLKSLNDNKLSQKSIEPSKYADEIFELYSVPSFVQEYPEIIKGEEIKSNKQVVNKNDVLLCKINPRINRVWIVNNHTEYRTIASTEWIVVSPIKNVYPAFLMNAMRSNYFRTLLISNSSGVGGSLTRAKSKDVIEYPIPLPPLPEQKRIVQRVESLLDKINEAKQLIEEAKETFANRRASILAKAFRGELTKKWREENPDVEPADILLERIREEREKIGTNKKGKKRDKELPPIDPPYELPEGWKWVRLGDIATITMGQSPKGDTYNEEGIGIPLINGPVEFGPDAFSTCRMIKWTTSPTKMCEKNDLLLCVRGSTGRMNIAGFKACIGRGVASIRVPYIQQYVNYKIHSLQDYIFNLGSGSTLSNITSENIRNIPVELPPFKEALKIVDLLDNLISLEKYSIEMLEEKREKLEKIAQAVLTKAFRGELGTNNPGEESAIELLKETLLKQIKPTTKNQEKNVQQELEFN
ncbi:restriction endonuclease subunit S [Thermoactinomyces sp. Gus2-1]|uniref:restriction endonuclease subunit S n=1 Tax=unclassified Thermoactinomyces TaxID=2634588 RepID=UPI00068B2FA6|nr:restriction endonuclease subunit S [Thermoactinomyces sp. Gus2-1]